MWGLKENPTGWMMIETGSANRKRDLSADRFQVTEKSLFLNTIPIGTRYCLEIYFRIIVAAFQQLFHFFLGRLSWIGACAGV